MLQFPLWKRLLVIGVVLLGAWLSLPNLLSASQREAAPGFIPSETVKLGLDLKGGSYLLLEVDPKELQQNRLRELSRDIQRELIKKPNNVKFRGREVADGGVRFRVLEPSQADEAIRRVKELSSPVGGIGGPQSLAVENQNGVITVRFSDAKLEELEVEALDDSIEVVRRRVDGSGTTDPNIQRQGSNRIVLEVPGLDDPTDLIALIQRAGVMSINLVDEDADPTQYRLDEPRLGKVKHQDAYSPREYVVFEDPILTGADFANASQGFDESNRPQIDFTLKGRGPKVFGDFTSQNVGRTFAIVLDGKVISAASVRTPILSGSGRITGSFEIQEANAIAIVLRAGELPAKLQVVEQRVVGAGLGEDSIRAGTTASIVGLVLVAVFMIMAYGLWGGFAVVSLAANIMLIIGALSGLGATLTLPGIAGIILTIGMAVDANVLVFERIREEARNGRSPITSVEIGYKQATSTIFDANITTLIAAAVLFQLGSGPVKGFAVTLGIGVVTSVFTAFVLTRMFMADWLRILRPKKLPV
ncbi:protein translocase subunit SecD [Hirschia litorea]|uniref:Protein translocase subunit SecD n=1 Tax=Hirschia litorea TaxID=1199156 RepID=A0ABW2IH97_9PROT